MSWLPRRTRSRYLTATGPQTNGSSQQRSNKTRGPNPTPSSEWSEQLTPITAQKTLSQDLETNTFLIFKSHPSKPLPIPSRAVNSPSLLKFNESGFLKNTYLSISVELSEMLPSGALTGTSCLPHDHEVHQFRKRDICSGLLLKLYCILW